MNMQREEQISREDIEQLAHWMGWTRLTWRDEPEPILRGTPPGTLPDARATFPPSRLDCKGRFCDGNGMLWLMDTLHDYKHWEHSCYELIRIDIDQNDCSGRLTPSIGVRGSLCRTRGDHGSATDLPHKVLRMVIAYLKQNHLIESEQEP